MNIAECSKNLHWEGTKQSSLQYRLFDKSRLAIDTEIKRACPVGHSAVKLAGAIVMLDFCLPLKLTTSTDPLVTTKMKRISYLECFFVTSTTNL
jgi:hypothetical protein